MPLFFCVAFVFPLLPACARQHVTCTDCGDLIIMQHRTHQCITCAEKRRHVDHHTQPLPPPTEQKEEPSPPSDLSMFGRPTGCIDQLTIVERAAILTLHGIGWTGQDIAQEIHCSENTVSLWLKRWEETLSLEDSERSGRPRCTTDDIDQEIGLYSDAHVNALPRDIVRELELTVSARTVRRRRIEIDLHTFVKRHEHAFTDFDLKRRIAYAEGYSSWTAAVGPSNVE